MGPRALILLAATSTVLAAQGPAPRRLTGITVPLVGDFGTMSGAYELKDGQVLLSDAAHAAVWIADPKSGATRRLGSPGADSGQYAQPGGFYPARGDSIYLLDRGQAKVLVISPAGVIAGSRSIRQLGHSGSSSDDVDHQRVDSRARVYFMDESGRFRAMLTGRAMDSAILVRLEPTSQRLDTVTRLRRPEAIVKVIDERSTTSREVVGSPADEWGIAGDGRVAVVRAAPLRVEWWQPDGSVVRGPVIRADDIPWAQSEKDSVASRHGSGGTQASSGGDPGAGAGREAAASGPVFATSKAPLVANGMLVARDGRVWVQRTQRAGATTTLFDVFDARGDRVDRVELAAASHIIGFGKSSVYAVERNAGGHVTLHRYTY